MTEGKLVRDLIPDIIRKSGRHPEVQHLSGDELVRALGAKLREEAAEAAEVSENRDALGEELADVTEVISALMALHGIDHQEVIDAAHEKAARRGQFETGAWLTSVD